MAELFILLCVLQAVDAWTTLQVLKRGGVEANPMVRYFIDHYGAVPALVGLKVVVLMFVMAVWAHVTFWLLLALVVFYVGVVANNLRVMRG